VVNLHISLKLLWKPFDQQFEKQINNFRTHQKNVEKEANLSHMVEVAHARKLELAENRGMSCKQRQGKLQY